MHEASYSLTDFRDALQVYVLSQTTGAWKLVIYWLLSLFLCFQVEIWLSAHCLDVTCVTVYWFNHPMLLYRELQPLFGLFVLWFFDFRDAYLSPVVSWTITLITMAQKELFQSQVFLQHSTVTIQILSSMDAAEQIINSRLMTDSHSLVLKSTPSGQVHFQLVVKRLHCSRMWAGVNLDCVQAHRAVPVRCNLFRWAWRQQWPVCRQQMTVAFLSWSQMAWALGLELPLLHYKLISDFQNINQVLSQTNSDQSADSKWQWPSCLEARKPDGISPRAGATIAALQTDFWFPEHQPSVVWDQQWPVCTQQVTVAFLSRSQCHQAWGWSYHCCITN